MQIDKISKVSNFSYNIEPALQEVSVLRDEIFPSFSGELENDYLVTKNFKYINFNSFLHFNSNDESDDGTFYKSMFNFYYSFYNKNYEYYLSQDLNLLEIYLPNYYLCTLEDKISDFFDYFDVWKQRAEFSNDSFLSKKLNFFDITDNYNTDSSKKQFFPWYMNIYLNTATEGSFVKILKKYNLFKSFFNYYVNAQKEILSLTKIPSDDFSLIKNYNLLNIDEYIKNIFNETSEVSLIAELNKFIVEQKISFSDIIKNKKCYSEIIGYKICKYAFDNDNATPLAEWFIPANDKNYLNLYDTQIKYDKSYTYKVFCINLVLSAECTIDKKKFTNNASFNLFEIESSKYTNLLLAHPPVEPFVDIIPHVSNGIENKRPNKIKFNLNSTLDKKTVHLFSLKEDEYQTIQKLLTSQQTSIENVTCSGQDKISKFEIYKLDKPPIEITDFRLAKQIDVPVNNLPSYSYLDSVVYNKKFYYMFRTISVHNLFSNPSDIYEIEIVNDNGNIYPIINIYDMESRNKNFQISSFPFNRAFMIEPSLGQIILNDTQVSFNPTTKEATNVFFGVNEESLWDKNVKFRIVSKSTGRKFDINVRFTAKQDKK